MQPLHTVGTSVICLIVGSSIHFLGEMKVLFVLFCFFAKCGSVLREGGGKKSISE